MKTVIQQLEDLVNDNVKDVILPYKKGNSIIIGKCIIRKTVRGYYIFDKIQNKKIAETYCQASALAYGRTYNKNSEQAQEILEIDRMLEKHCNDSMFHQHTLDTTSNSVRADIAEMRLDISKSRAESTRQLLDRYIFG